MERVTDVRELKLIANTIRQDIIRSLTEAGSGHSAGPLGMADVFTVLYFNVLNHDPDNPNWEGRDYLLLSNGHICPVLYATMANAGYFPKEELMTLRKLGTRLQGHPHRLALPGLETSSGPLGSGLSQAAGMAYGLKMDSKPNLVYCLTGDGEHDEGNLWEAVMFAGKYRLDNLIAVVDRNYIQIDGNTEDVMPLNPTKDKYLAFNWDVVEINGNDIKQIITAMNTAKLITEKPTMIIANNVPGKGVSFMENDYQWHGKPPTPEQAEIALAELRHESKQLQRKDQND
ncbi:MAG: transketolase [Gammaproteobacteria bacterium]